jgi:hypothetical protein
MNILQALRMRTKQGLPQEGNKLHTCPYRQSRDRCGLVLGQLRNNFAAPSSDIGARRSELFREGFEYIRLHGGVCTGGRAGNSRQRKGCAFDDGNVILAEFESVPCSKEKNNLLL